MARQTKEIWLSAPKALELLAEVNGRPIHPKYLSQLARGDMPKIERRRIDGRTYEYKESDIVKLHIAAHRRKEQSA